MNVLEASKTSSVPARNRWLNPWRLMALPLTVATIGGAIPFGASDRQTYTLTPYEWALTILFMMAALLLLVALWRPSPTLLRWAFAMAGFSWAVVTAYQIFRDQTWTDSLGLSLMSAGWAVSGLLCWRAVEVVKSRGRTP